MSSRRSRGLRTMGTPAAVLVLAASLAACGSSSGNSSSSSATGTSTGSTSSSSASPSKHVTIAVLVGGADNAYQAAGVKAIVRLWPESEGLLHKFFNLDTDATVCLADMCGASDPSHFRYLMSEAQTNSPAWESSETLSALSMLNYYKTFAKHQYCAAACDLMSVIWTWFDEGYLDDGDAEEVLKMLGARCGAKTAAKALKMHARGGFVDDYLGEILKKKTFITNADEMRKVLPWW